MYSEPSEINVNLFSLRCNEYYNQIVKSSNNNKEWLKTSIKKLLNKKPRKSYYSQNFNILVL